MSKNKQVVLASVGVLLAQKMTKAQLDKVIEVIGDKRPAKVGLSTQGLCKITWSAKSQKPDFVINQAGQIVK